MESITIEELSDHFQTKLSHLNTLLQLRGVTKAVDFRGLLTSVRRAIVDMEMTVSMMKALVARDKKNLQKFEVMKGTVTKILSDTDHMNENVPSHLPKVQRKTQSSAPALPLQTKQVQQRASVTGNGRKHTEPSKQITPAVQKPEERLPSIEYLTVEEFDGVPKYMKGRMTYEKMNSVIDDLNHVFEVKYKLFRQPMSKMAEKMKTRAREYKAQENKDTKGTHFIVENDIKTNCNLKLDKASKTLFTILRHCQRLKEVRGGKLTRYVLCEYLY